MPVTRSNSGRSQRPQPDEGGQRTTPIEPSGTTATTSSGTAATESETTAATTVATVTTQHKTSIASKKKSKSRRDQYEGESTDESDHAEPERDNRSTRSSRALRLAKAKEAELRVRLKLAKARIAVIEAEGSDDEVDDDSVISNTDTQQRVGQWLHTSQIRDSGPITEPPPVIQKRLQVVNTTAAADAPHPVRSTKDENAISPPHAHSHTKVNACHSTSPEQNINLSELAAAITLAAKSGHHSTSRFITELPQYFGSHQEWLSFKAAYTDTSPSFTKIENTARLRKCLKGRAREAVENLLICGGQPEAIMKALESRFGRPDSIALAELDHLRTLNRPTDTPKDICVFANRVANIVATLQALNRTHYLYSPEAMKNAVDKLTPVLKYRWYDYAAEHTQDEADLLKLSRFLEREADRCGPYAQPETNLSSLGAATETKKRTHKTFNTTNKPAVKCPLCSNEGHNVIQCDKFKEADTSSRWDIAKTQRLCFRCLRFRARSHSCPKRKCKEDGCERSHHKLLHFKQSEENDDSQKCETVASTWTRTGTLAYLKILPVKVSGPAGEIDTYALLDDGSTVTLIDNDIVKKAGVRGTTDPLHIEAIASTKINVSRSRRVTLTIHGATRNHRLNARTIENLQLSPQTITEEDLGGCKHLYDLERDLKYQNAKPGILIGQDNWHLLIASEVRRGQRHQPVASRTPLGWVLHGAHTRTLGHTVNFVNHIVTPSEDNMEDQLKRFFAIESLTIEPKRPVNDPDTRALTKLSEYATRTDDGHYQMPLLWKRDDIDMPDNYDNTLRRLYSTERKIDKNLKLKEKYNKQMEALVQKGYAEPAPSQKTENRTWYLPHFPVLNPMKPNKVRVVHDAAAKTQGVSLNDHLLTGPDLLQSLPGVLMRFRQHSIAITADIQEMFMQVKIRPEDRDALRYLWRGDRRDDRPPEEYRMTSLIFGATCSPAIAIHVKNINAAKFEKQYPRAAAAIVNNHYVDDYLHSYTTIEEAITTAKQVQEIHNQAHFELRQWASNSPEVIEAINPSAPVTTSVNINDDTKTERVLGLIWTPSSDELTFDLNMFRLPEGALEIEKPTKRELLRIVMSVFDPLGLASPVTINAKRILQEVWRRGTGWDDKLDDDLSNQWRSWVQHLKSLHNIRIPRCYSQYSQATSLELHVFVDASESTYACAIYWRAVTADDEVRISIVTAKARVAPLKTTSIPRLELQAAVMGSRMAATVIREHDKKPESTTYWTDSRTVLTWLRTGSRSYKPFVAHRIAAIEENSPINSWRWIPTKLNVADDATREVPPGLGSEHRWYRGPDFLRSHPSTWPTELSTMAVLNTGEEKVNHLRENESKYKLSDALPNVDRFSKWERLIRSTARVLQFIQKCRASREKVHYKRTKENKKPDATWKPIKKTSNDKIEQPTRGQTRINHRKIPSIEASLLRRAEELIIRSCQQKSFADELEKLTKKEAPSTGSRLKRLSLTITNEVIRIKTRIASTQGITDTQKQPAVIDGNSTEAKMYIDYIHRKLHHAGVECTINECRQHYWIVRLRPIARMVIHRCIECRKKRAKPPTPPTGDHPECRVAHHRRPFTYTGVDYFGPLTVAVNRSTQKRYVALFTCLTTRAVHLELAGSLSTESAVMALRRMIARRGCPTEIWSDNGTNLRGADRELLTAAAAATEDEASRRVINWRYIPPGAPFMGGAWERLVRSTKTALDMVLHERRPTEEVLTTLLAEVEFTLNSRPLTHVSVDPTDPEALTPNHFLLHGPGLVPTLGTFDDKDLIGKTHWRASQRLADMFWSRWMKEYLPDLQNRREPHGRGPSLKVGDVVLIADNTLPRNTWPLGIITATYPGADAVVRAVDVRTKGSVLRRPVKKLVLIPSERPDTHHDS